MLKPPRPWKVPPTPMAVNGIERLNPMAWTAPPMPRRPYMGRTLPATAPLPGRHAKSVDERQEARRQIVGRFDAPRRYTPDGYEVTTCNPWRESKAETTDAELCVLATQAAELESRIEHCLAETRRILDNR